MIALLSGKIVRKSASGVILDVNGVGYDVLCPLTVLDVLPPSGNETTLCIYTHVREDQITLFGFADEDEKYIFKLLISVSGIGPKLGLACLSGMSQPDLCSAINDDDAKRLSTIPGIGKRTAERLILELKGKVLSTGIHHVPNQSSSSMMDDLASALKNLGYKEKEVDQLIASLEFDGEPKFEVLLKEALKKIRKGSR